MARKNAEGNPLDPCLFEEVIKAAKDPIIMHEIEGDIPGRIIYVNNALCELTGYDQDTLTGKSLLEIIPRERALLGRKITKSLEENGDARFFSYILDARKEWVPVEVNSSLLHWKGKKVVLSMIRISRKAKKEGGSVFNREYFLESVFNAIQEGISVLDTDLNIIKVNYWMEKMYREKAPLEGKRCHEVYQLRNSICPWCPTVKAIESGNVYTEIVPYPSQEKRTGWLELSAFPIKDTKGKVIGVIEYVKDITKRVKAEEENRRLAAAIHQAGECIVITDTKGDIQYVNPAFEKVTGYSREEVKGMNPRILKSGMHDPSFYLELWSTIASGKTWKGRFKNKKKNGELFDEEATISPVKDDQGNIFAYVKVGRDVTKELALERQMQEAQRMEAIGRLAGGIAHDFNNLLLAIFGHLDLARLSLPLSHEAREHILNAEKAAKKAADLTKQLLAFGRRQPLRPRDIDLNEVIRELADLLKRILSENIGLDVILGHDLGTIHADMTQMEQVIMNLVLNARDAMPGGGKITIETENVVINGAYVKDHPWAKEGRYVLLTVTDTGAGIPQEILPHIFEPFYTTKKEPGNLGMGLSTVHGIIHQHGGIIHVYSEEGKGTSFKIYLPIVERRAVSVGNKITGPAAGGTETVLVAEDDDTVRELAKKILEKAGYTVLSARDGREALEIFKNHKKDISLAFLDIVMPGIGGMSLAETFEKEKPGIKILFTSGYSANAIHDNFILHKGVHHIPKPYEAEGLLRKVREVLNE